jgi:ApeA N-terminal domain 1
MSEPTLKAEGVFKWYIPGADADDRQLVAGTLEISNDGVSTLSLVGMLPVDSHAELPFVRREINEERWIVGVLKDSRYVFLGGLNDGGSTLGRVISHQAYRARDCLVFQHLDEFPDITAVTRLLVGLDFLGDWVQDSAVEVIKTRRGANARAICPKPKTYKLASKTVRIVTSIRYTAPTVHLHRSVTIKQETFFEIEPKSPAGLESMRQEFHLLEDLLLLLSDADVALPWPTLKFGDKSCLYYFERRRTDPQEVEKFKSWALLAWVADGFGALLTKLEEQQDILGPGLYLYLGIRRGEGLYLENRFSTAIFGLESLHRRVGSSDSRPKLEAKIARILGDVKQKRDRDWLSGRLRNAGEPSLEERLFLTFSEIDIGLEEAALRAFSKECADLRNQVAHFGGQRDGGYADFVHRMHILNEAVRPLYHAVLLNRIGFERERTQAYFHRSPYSTQRKRMLGEAGLTFTTSSTGASSIDVGGTQSTSAEVDA